MEIRPIEECELDQLLELYKYLHEQDDPLPEMDVVRKVWSKIQNNNESIYYGIFIDHQLICSCCLALIENFTRGCRPYAVIENVVTHQEFRRQGYGHRILVHALKYAWSKNCYKVMLLTSRLNEETFKFYESAGFNRHAKQAFIAKP